LQDTKKQNSAREANTPVLVSSNKNRVGDPAASTLADVTFLDACGNKIAHPKATANRSIINRVIIRWKLQMDGLVNETKGYSRSTMSIKLIVARFSA